MQLAAAYTQAVLQSGHDCAALVRTISHTLLAMPPLPDLSSGVYQDPMWPAQVVEADPIRWATFMKLQGDDWRLGITAAVPTRFAAAMPRPDVSKYLDEGFVRDAPGLPQFEVRAAGLYGVSADRVLTRQCVGTGCTGGPRTSRRVVPLA